MLSDQKLASVISFNASSGFNSESSALLNQILSLGETNKAQCGNDVLLTEEMTRVVM